MKMVRNDKLEFYECDYCHTLYPFPIYIPPTHAIVLESELGGYKQSEEILIPACPFCFRFTGYITVSPKGREK